MKFRHAVPLLIAAFIGSAAPSKSFAAEIAKAADPTTSATAVAAGRFDPSKIEWVTNGDDPQIGNPAAPKGGTLTLAIDAFPLTFRLMGPNSNDAFAAWNRAYTMSFTLVLRHPDTDRYIPGLATHWAVLPDQKTVLYKLDPDARWSDGRPITAEDFVFTAEMMASKFIVDPWYNQYVADYFEKVDSPAPGIVRITGKRPSWRPLDDYNLFPSPRHATQLGPDWVTKTNRTFQLAAGPYVVTEAKDNERVVLTRIPNWWGEKKRYFQGQFNVDRIVLRVIPEDDREFDAFRKGDLTVLGGVTARRWATELDFDAVKKGWIRKKRVFVEFPEGLSGFTMNLDFPLFQNRNFRKAIQHGFDFETLNKQIMYGAYYRKTSHFEGSAYANPNLKGYEFNPGKVREYLKKAGFEKRGSDGIFVDGKGNRASFRLLYGSKALDRHLTLVQQTYKKLGIEVRLEQVESGTSFNRQLERKYEMGFFGYTTGFFPEPHQYFSSTFLKETNNNNIWKFGTPETDKLIETYRFDLDLNKRKEAMATLDAILEDEAFIVLGWGAPYLKLVYWNGLEFPKTWYPRRTEQWTDWQVFWIDPAKDAETKAAITANTSLPLDKEIDVDLFGVKAKKAAGSPKPAAATGLEVPDDGSGKPATQPANQ